MNIQEEFVGSFMCTIILLKGFFLLISSEFISNFVPSESRKKRKEDQQIKPLYRLKMILNFAYFYICLFVSQLVIIGLLQAQYQLSIYLFIKFNIAIKILRLLFIHQKCCSCLKVCVQQLINQ
ncbi:transmembrane protein, putative (macronuclear) [Tetrahymena thermophila SB210]|uniref:Transmembrane protein, putative n=1 Tax=Tetrahymena thermophila (strain SB210) TaxID=312017 RepID=A4VF35_TETTS|nr:transmembrane protein, putative [Tetrahymena thermophila SB210]EDK31215.1 transmembrane protein, putative [Tetrahymena thermophila SB210]|eukprot:XP_001470654.1 transmembrane protein, putative [Tetrahymena thermophila SB210]